MSDPYFLYVGALLHFDDANGSTNTLDSSSYGLPVTITGSAAITSASTKFGIGSLSCGGGTTADGASIPVVTRGPLDLSSGDFTIEFSFRPAASHLGIFQPLLSNFSAGPVTGWYTALNNMRPEFGTASADFNTASPLVPGVWYDFAVVRSGNTFAGWIDGVQFGSFIYSGTVGPIPPPLFSIASSPSFFSVGFDGDIDEVRITRLARYTPGVNYTPDTDPFPEPSDFTAPSNLVFVKTTDLTGTLSWDQSTSQSVSTPPTPALLLHFDDPNGSTTTTDSSPNNFPVTFHGAAAISDTNPAFGMGCLGTLFGSPNFLSIPVTPSGPLDLSNGDFTVECWVFMQSYIGGFSFPLLNICNSSGSPFAGIDLHGGFGASQGNIACTFGNGTATPTFFVGTDSPPLNKWSHIAVARQGNNFGLWIDGIPNGQVPTSSAPIGTDTNLFIGMGASYGSGFPGLIDEIRITNGTARYTPGLPFAIAQESPSILMHFDGNFTDSGPYNLPVTPNGGATTSGAQVKFGTESALFNGATSYASTPIITGGPLDIGLGDFTIEGWMYAGAQPGGQSIMFYFGDGTTASAYLYYQSSSNTYVGAAFGGGINGPATVAQNTWNHFALVVSGSSIVAYLNGVGGTPGTTGGRASIGGGSFALVLGDQLPNGVTPYAGYIDEFRVTKGTALYKGNFTPPTAPFSFPPAPYGYEVFRDAVSIGTTTTLSLFDAVGAFGTYEYTVAAWDGLMDVSDLSSPLDVVFSPAPLTQVLYGKFVPASVFAPTLLIDAKGIKPRIWMPKENITVRT